ncbi:hypothetical protein F442_09032 [Phytophthora nicotianae P10297]|nr:hypothetical protein F442_09032 [Phytophthora nicotianae P10297]
MRIAYVCYVAVAFATQKTDNAAAGNMRMRHAEKLSRRISAAGMQASYHIWRRHVGDTNTYDMSSSSRTTATSTLAPQQPTETAKTTSSVSATAAPAPTSTLGSALVQPVTRPQVEIALSTQQNGLQRDGDLLASLSSYQSYDATTNYGRT